LLLGRARIYDQLQDSEAAILMHKKVLSFDASCVESIACLGAHFFYTDQVKCCNSHVLNNAQFFSLNYQFVIIVGFCKWE
jgi:tetratricopeptide repeat protein 8